MIRTTTDKAAVVDTTIHWIDAKETPPPVGPKLLVINRTQGIAVLSPWRDTFGWTHWAPLPTFKEN